MYRQGAVSAACRANEAFAQAGTGEAVTLAVLCERSAHGRLVHALCTSIMGLSGTAASVAKAAQVRSRHPEVHGAEGTGSAAQSPRVGVVCLCTTDKLREEMAAAPASLLFAGAVLHSPVGVHH